MQAGGKLFLAALLFFLGLLGVLLSQNCAEVVTKRCSDKALTKVAQVEEVQAFYSRVDNEAIRVDTYPVEHDYYLIQVYEAHSDHTATHGWYKVYPRGWRVERVD